MSVYFEKIPSVLREEFLILKDNNSLPCTFIYFYFSKMLQSIFYAHENVCQSYKREKILILKNNATYINFYVLQLFINVTKYFFYTYKSLFQHHQIPLIPKKNMTLLCTYISNFHTCY